MPDPCRCSYPCDCGSPAHTAEAALADALAFIGDQLRRERLASLGAMHQDILPWGKLTRSEQNRWRDEARAVLAQGEAA